MSAKTSTRTSATPRSPAPGVTLYRGDCLDVLAGLPADSVDTVITDPPYGLAFMGTERIAAAAPPPLPLFPDP